MPHFTQRGNNKKENSKKEFKFEISQRGDGLFNIWHRIDHTLENYHNIASKWALVMVKPSIKSAISWAQQNSPTWKLS